MTNVLISGIGGQGTVLAARLIGLAAILNGLDVRGSETIGMAQRGGSVVSHVRIGKNIASPLIPQGKADAILAFEPGEALRSAGHLSPGGAMLVSSRVVGAGYDPAEAKNWLNKNIPGVHWIDGESIIAETGARSLNVAMIGAAISLNAFDGAIGMETLERAIKERLPEKFWEGNIRALHHYKDMDPQIQPG